MTGIRVIVRVTTAAIAAVCLTMGTPASAQTPQGKPPMTLVSFGGAFTKSQMLAFVRPYRKSRITTVALTRSATRLSP